MKWPSLWISPPMTKKANATTSVWLAAAVGCMLGLGAGVVWAKESQTARAEMINQKGEHIGDVTFAQKGDVVKVSVQAKNLPPGSHGLHVHQNGDCQKPDFKSAGAHLASPGQEHGLKNPHGPHSGDLPNLQVGKDGTARAEILAKNLRLEGTNSLLKEGGAALIIHAQGDDNRSQPAGASGDRIACGVIKRS